MLAQKIKRGLLGFTQGVERTGQDHGHGASVRHRAHAGFVQILDMVRRQRAIACRQFRAAQIGQLFGVQFHRQAKVAGHVKHAADLGGLKGDAFAEPVHRIHQPFGVGGAQSGDADLVNIVIVTTGIFGGRGVGAKEGGLDADGALVGNHPCDTQHPKLSLRVQTIARFDFDGRHAFGDQHVNAAQGLRQQLVLAGRAGGRDGRHDATPGARDFFIASPVQAHFEFDRAVAAMYDMGVTVDQAGCHHAPAQRPLIQSGIICWHVCLRTDPSDFAILNGDRCVADHPIGRIAMRHGCYVQIGQKLEHRRHKIGPFREVSPFLV